MYMYSVYAIKSETLTGLATALFCRIFVKGEFLVYMPFPGESEGQEIKICLAGEKFLVARALFWVIDCYQFISSSNGVLSITQGDWQLYVLEAYRQWINKDYDSSVTSAYRSYKSFRDKMLEYIRLYSNALTATNILGMFHYTEQACTEFALLVADGIIEMDEKTHKFIVKEKE
jgi:hypothetical protein